MIDTYVCHRCGNQLRLGMMILDIHTVAGVVRRRLCGACNTELQAWFATYPTTTPAVERPFSDITPQIEYWKERK